MRPTLKRLLLWVCLALVATATATQAQSPEEVVYFHTDAVGSIRLTTAQNGQPIEHHDYAPFGEAVQIGAGPSRFAGSERDGETSMQYFGARYYLPVAGRFTSVDPVLDAQKALLDPQLWNRYAYVRNSPLRYVDPDGRALETVWDTFNIGLGFSSLIQNIRDGNYGSAAVDAGGILIDTGAAAVPFLPGGIASVIRASREATVVYRSVKSGEKTVQYVGITNNLSRRALEHLAEKGIKIQQIQNIGRLSRADARAVEQALIEIHKLEKDGGTLINKINSISKSNADYAERLKRGMQLLESNGYVLTQTN